MEQTHERAHKKRGLLWLLLFALIICGLGAYFYFQKDPVPIISADLLPEAGDATDQRSGSIEIVNPGTNVYPIAVDITLSNGELVYSSGAIYPNQFVENVNLITPLAKGEYQAKATINIYDPETKEKQGVTEAELTIIVKN